MKKFYLLMALVGIWISSFAGGYIADPQNIAITTTDWTEITASRSMVGFIVKTRNGNNFKISSSASGTTYYTVYSAASNPVVEFNCRVPKDTLIFYVQSLNSNDTLEILIKK
uniref:Uncharacterized protein n=1 Tax=viral metagenome TaxID=1070528 RepID=A0A6H1ZEY1_9ZZZZ